ncbi:MAG: alanine/glycine:cation symporter family protein [Cyanobacteriota bacterium]|nr:alanine/glycine:cation symporter family protein [Cyanobacteriota bacterium]
MNFLDQLSATFSQVLELINNIIFFDIGGMPLIVIWLIAAGAIFTVWMRFINLRAFKHAIDIIRGKYDHPEDIGEVSHFQALATALSATLGLGNIAGVAIAIGLGGPGACFWLTLAGFLGMTTKFVECTLAQKYRLVKPDGSVAGGPMYYLSEGLSKLGLPGFGKILAILFATLAICGALGSSSIYQSNQSLAGVAQVIPILAEKSWIYGLVMVGLVGLVIIGGIRRIASVAATIVPVMCGLYILGAVWVILFHFTEIPAAVTTILSSAFSLKAATGGTLGAIIQGFRRSAFSNEAGLGIAAIAHSVAKTDQPIREGLVATLEPFIDTVIVCNLTALVIILTDAYNNPEFANLGGSELTSAAFSTVIPWFPYVLAVAVFLFAFSTMISWGYYGQLCWEYLLGGRTAIVYKLLFLLAIFMGSVANPTAVIEFSDAMYLTMALPNILGMYFLADQVSQDLKDYFQQLKG